MITIERCTYGDLPLYGLFYGEWGIIFLRSQAQAESARDMLMIDWEKVTRYVAKHHKPPPAKVYKQIYDVCCLFDGFVVIGGSSLKRTSALKPEYMPWKN